MTRATKNRAAPGIRSWDSAKCPICQATLGDDYIELSLKSCSSLTSRRLTFCCDCYMKIDKRRFAFDGYYCSLCSEPVLPGDSQVLCRTIEICQPRTVYIMHSNCFEELAGSEFWYLNFLNII